MAVRVYKVVEKGPSVVRLVKASHPAQAIAHVSRGRFEASVPSVLEAVELMQDGIKVEDATEADEPPTAPAAPAASDALAACAEPQQEPAPVEV